MRTVIIGDIHGCLDELERLLDALGPVQGERLIFLGDLVSRGPFSLGVLRRVRELVGALPGSRCLMGNHELRLVDRRAAGQPVPDWCQRLGPEDWAFMAGLPLLAPLPELGAIAVHAGIPPAWFDRFGELTAPAGTWRSATGERALLLRSCVAIRRVDEAGWPIDDSLDPGIGYHWSERYAGQAGFCFYGHDPALWPPEPRPAPHALGLDTGCVMGGRLSAALLATGEDPRGARIVSVPAARAYAEPSPRMLRLRAAGAEAAPPDSSSRRRD